MGTPRRRRRRHVDAAANWLTKNVDGRHVVTRTVVSVDVTVTYDVDDTMVTVLNGAKLPKLGALPKLGNKKLDRKPKRCRPGRLRPSPAADSASCRP